MDTTLAITLIMTFAIIAEVLTYITRNDNNFTRMYVITIRLLVLFASISFIKVLDTNNSSLPMEERREFLKEANNFKKNLLDHEEKLNHYQDSLIQQLVDHDFEYHNCDAPCLDSDLPLLIKEQQDSIKQIYKSQE